MNKITKKEFIQLLTNNKSLFCMCHQLKYHDNVSNTFNIILNDNDVDKIAADNIKLSRTVKKVLSNGLIFSDNSRIDFNNSGQEFFKKDNVIIYKWAWADTFDNDNVSNMHIKFIMYYIYK